MLFILKGEIILKGFIGGEMPDWMIERRGEGLKKEKLVT